MVTQAQLHELFEYREDGNLIRKVSTSSRSRAGDIAGSLHIRGYYRVRVNYETYKLHRLIFLYHHGHLTRGMQIDHIDGNTSNNRIENLREVTPTQNQQNSKIPSNNTSGVKGVFRPKNRSKWNAQIRIAGKIKHLGCYNTLEEAEAIVKEAREKYHGEYARHE